MGNGENSLWAMSSGGFTLAMLNFRILLPDGISVYAYTISSCWLVGDHLLSKDFKPYGIIFIACVLL
jgi:hypothetical protein